MSNWLEKQFMSNRQSSGKNYFIFWKNGDTRVIRFVMEPTEETIIPYGEHFYGKSYHYCPSTEQIVFGDADWNTLDCPLCHALNSGPTIKGVSLVIDGTDENKVKVIKASRLFWNRIIERKAELDGAGDSILNYWWQVTREGEKLPNYKIIREPRPSQIPNSLIFPDGMDFDNYWNWLIEFIESQKETVDQLRAILEGSAAPSGSGFSNIFAPKANPHLSSSENEKKFQTPFSLKSLNGGSRPSKNDPPNLLSVIREDNPATEETPIVKW